MRYRGSWWRDFFQRLEASNTIDLTSTLDNECLWYCFSKVIQKDLDDVKDYWNSHRIRKSRHDTVAGRLDVLQYLPERSGGSENLKLIVPEAEIAVISQEIDIDNGKNDYQDYFEYVQNSLSLPDPKNANEALEVF